MPFGGGLIGVVVALVGRGLDLRGEMPAAAPCNIGQRTAAFCAIPRVQARELLPPYAMGPQCFDAAGQLSLRLFATCIVAT